MGVLAWEVSGDDSKLSGPGECRCALRVGANPIFLKMRNNGDYYGYRLAIGHTDLMMPVNRADACRA
jgi:hypothetical protein